MEENSITETEPATTQAATPRYLNAVQAAAYWSEYHGQPISARAISGAAAAGRLPFHRVEYARGRLFLAADLERYVKSPGGKARRSGRKKKSEAG